MKYIWILRCSFWLFPGCIVAQVVSEERDLRSAWVPRSVILSMEASGQLQQLWCRCGRTSEIELQLLFKRLLIESQVGYAERRAVVLPKGPSQPERSRENYLSEGFFWRLGPLLRIGPDRKGWTGSLGFLYAEAGYQEEMQVSRLDPLRNYEANTFAQQAWQRLRWWEISFGFKVDVWKGIMLGYRTHFAFGAKKEGEKPALVSYYAPGYGYPNILGKFGIRYYIGYQIPLIKQKNTRK